MPTQDETIAFVFLGYLVLPLVFFFLMWVVNVVRRRVFKKGIDEAPAEGEA